MQPFMGNERRYLATHELICQLFPKKVERTKIMKKNKRKLHEYCRYYKLLSILEYAQYLFGNLRQNNYVALSG